jgi:DNA-binding response OmpR family regulator
MSTGGSRDPGVPDPIRRRTVSDVVSGRVLLIEDDERIGSSLVRALSGTGYDARWERRAAEGLAAATAARPDLVLLDLTLPDLDGIEVCRRLHQVDATISVIMLTARDEVLDIVVGLDAGAIDYVTKPFELAELLARVRAQLRTPRPGAGAATRGGDLTVDPSARRAWLGGHELELRAKEFDLLARLSAAVGNVVTREELMADVWDVHWPGSTKTLDFHIAALRRKLDGDGHDSRITTLRGVGYRLEDR